MPILADVHVHSNYSGDSDASIESQVQKAIACGMKYICITDHNDFDYPYQPQDKPDMFLLNADSYLYELLSVRKKYEDRIKVLFGVELGLEPGVLRKNLLFTKAHEYDFIIGSSHLCHGKDPYYAAFYEGRSEKEAYREYFESILENVKSFSNYDVYGHLDYVVRYGPNKNNDYSYGRHADIIDEILRQLIAHEKGIEVNTGGYRCHLGGPNPCADIIKRYHELGGEIITIGSDAHTPADLGSHFDTICDMLKELGFKYYCVFENRLPEYFRL